MTRQKENGPGNSAKSTFVFSFWVKCIQIQWKSQVSSFDMRKYRKYSLERSNSSRRNDQSWAYNSRGVFDKRRQQNEQKLQKSILHDTSHTGSCPKYSKLLSDANNGNV